jgi:hypothetical protein
MCPEHANELCHILTNRIYTYVRWQFITGAAIGGLLTAFVFIITG